MAGPKGGAEPRPEAQTMTPRTPLTVAIVALRRRSRFRCLRFSGAVRFSSFVSRRRLLPWITPLSSSDAFLYPLTRASAISLLATARFYQSPFFANPDLRNGFRSVVQLAFHGKPTQVTSSAHTSARPRSRCVRSGGVFPRGCCRRCRR